MRSVLSLSRTFTLSMRSVATASLKPNLVLPDNSLSIVESDGGLQAFPAVIELFSIRGKLSWVLFTLQYACFPKPNPWNGLTRIVAIFNAGSRFEKAPHIHGITHLIRRSCGLSTTNYTAVNLARHIQQMGGRLHCHTTREHMIYSMDVAPNLASRAGLILATMATRTAFFDWELRDQVYRLMHKDIDMLNRRRFDALTIELLHEAAYGQHPDGVGLGNSLFANHYRVGTHTIDDIEAFFDAHYTPVNTVFIVTGCNPNDGGLQICDSMHDAALLRPNRPACTTVAKHSFVGGERRREITGATISYAALAWPTPGGHVGESLTSLALSVFAAALTSPNHRIAFGSMGGFVPSSSSTATSTPIHFPYSDHGLFGTLVTGRDGKTVGEHLRLARRVYAQLAETGMNEDQFVRAKALFKADLAMRMENFITMTEDLAVQLLCCNKGGGGDQNVSGIRSLEDICSAVDRLSLLEVNKVFKETVKSQRMALSAVGTDIAYVEPLETLKTF
ncbi:unnamed protein product [Hydatigera taeniaeformis]|uniref:Mitochondrial processing peptidase beta subunit n=1 Tax=Hydatigena taeniaeformis TaxID=6205 RepID=A0A0R3X5K8_HYDTA|nr:unnamed protein product [Hydatigera taeniaeformis]